MALKWKVWIDSPSVGVNVQSSETFGSDTQRAGGFVSNTAASSIRVNTALRQANLVTVALMNSISTNESLSVESSVEDVTAEINNFFNPMFVNCTTSGTKLVFTKKNGQTLDVDLNNLLSGLTIENAQRADVATNVGTLTNNDTGNNARIAFTIGDKSFDKTITVTGPGSVEEAETVTGYIKIGTTKKAITSMFNTNGYAKNASSASQASKVGHKLTINGVAFDGSEAKTITVGAPNPIYYHEAILLIPGRQAAMSFMYFDENASVSANNLVTYLSSAAHTQIINVQGHYSYDDDNYVFYCVRKATSTSYAVQVIADRIGTDRTETHDLTLTELQQNLSENATVRIV